MATQVQIIRGTTAENEAFTGANGALTYDTERKQLRVHDGTTAGGKVVNPTLATVATSGSYNDLTNIPSNLQTTDNLVTAVSSASTDTEYPSAKLFYDTCGDIESLINAL